MRNIYVVTHAQSQHHVENLGGGWYDTSLTEKGISQAEGLAAYLFNEINRPGIPVYSSDLKRAAETAAIISRPFNSRVIHDKRLREMNFGEAGGKPAEWRSTHITPQPADGNRLDHRLFESAETRRAIGLRIKECLDDIAGIEDETIIIVTHGYTLTFIIMAWLKVPVGNMDYCHFMTAPASITLLREDDLYKDRYVVYLSKVLA
jgi:probable phosphoglycerate mutase